MEVFINGGRINTGIDAINWAKKAEALGAGEILLTSMDRDGTKRGFDLNLTKKISDSVGIPVIASGGIGKINHFVEGVKEESFCITSSFCFSFWRIWYF